MLSARRRLLGMLLMLAIGSGALAFTKLAAWWVVVPPSVMLLSYMALLREAAKADAEQRDLARTRAVRTVAAAPPVAVPTAAPPAPAPGAEVIDLSASLGPAGEEFYDQYADAKLRAVGDLTRALPGGSRVRLRCTGLDASLASLTTSARQFARRCDTSDFCGGFGLVGVFVHHRGFDQIH